MTAVITLPTRIFKMNTVRLGDPDPTMPPEQVRELYAASYPHLAAATVEGPVVTERGEVEYTFAPPAAKTKG